MHALASHADQGMSVPMQSVMPRRGPVIGPLRLIPPLLAGALLAGCSSVTETPERPLAVTVPVAGCAAAGQHFNTLEPAPANGTMPPGLTDWEANMIDYGIRRGSDMMAERQFTTRLQMNYYDGQRVFLQIADYTGEDDPWLTFAQRAEETYKQYLEQNDFRVAGYMRFPHGLFLDWQRNGDTESREYLLRIRDRGPFSNPEQPHHTKSWRDARFSREVAYALETQILAERAGAPRQAARVNLYVDMALAHIDAWLTGDFGHQDPDWRFCQAFMAGLTASALTAYDDHRAATAGGRDPRVLPAIRRLADWLWQTMWIAGVGGGNGDWYPHEDAPEGAFEYVQPRVDGVGSESPAPDLNLLIVPMYGWLWQQTGEPRFRDRGDAIFAGGVAMGGTEGGKVFNQQYRSSFDYVEWRVNGLTDATE
jgi:hypothetical protein